MKVMKFGGSSVRDAERIRTVCRILLENSDPSRIIAVFSAMKGVTDLLISATVLAETGDGRYRETLGEISAIHDTALAALLPAAGSETAASISLLLSELTEILHGIMLVRECSPRSLDLVMSFGERLSCTLITGYLQSIGRPAHYFDARSFIVTDKRHGNALVDFPATAKHTRHELKRARGIPVVTGFIAATADGVTTTLGRNGSDYTASLVGAAMGAEVIEIWTDVDGVLSADPRYVPTAFVIPELGVEEAMELSYFGAEVIHPYTMIPAVEHRIPIRIRNTLNPSAPGTVIDRNAKPHGHPITGIASIENVALINIQGGGMIGVPGIAARVFKALAEADVNVIMISQASSEHSICLVCRATETETAVEHLSRELANELKSKSIDSFDVKNDLEIISIIGENMRGRPGISGLLFDSLGKAGINVLAIAQGSSERNISFVINGKDRAIALNTVHGAFLDSRAAV